MNISSRRTILTGGILCAVLVLVICFSRSSRPTVVALPGATSSLEVGPHGGASRPDVVGVGEPGERQPQAGSLSAAGLAGGVFVLVLNPRGEPIEGAAVSWVTGHDSTSRTLAPTNAEGLTDVPKELRPPALVRAAAPGHVAGEVFHPDGADESVRITLAVGGVIFGTTVRAADSSVVSGIRVLAWPDACPFPPLDSVERALRGDDSRAFIAISDSDGRFTLEGVNPELTYTLVAAGNGFATESLRRGTSVSEHDLRVPLDPLYGIRVLVEHSEPEAHNELLCLLPPAVMAIDTRLPGATYIPQPSFVPRLAGLDTPSLQSSAVDKTYLFTSNSELRELGPTGYALTLAGMEPVHTAIKVPRIIDSIATTTIHVRPREGPRTRCSVRLLMPCGTTAGPSTRDPAAFGQVVFTPIGAPTPQEAQPSAFVIHNTKPIPVDCTVPNGEYRIHYVNLLTNVTVACTPDSGETHLLAGTDRDITIDLRSLGCLSVTLLDTDKTQMSGSLALAFADNPNAQDGQPFQMSYAFNVEAPYLIAPLKPGEYSIMNIGHSGGEFRHSPVTFSIQAGQTNELKLRRGH